VGLGVGWLAWNGRDPYRDFALDWIEVNFAAGLLRTFVSMRFCRLCRAI
jgi:hypothetical protein